MPADAETRNTRQVAIPRENTEVNMDRTPLVGSANCRRPSRIQPPVQCDENVVPTWQTFRRASAFAVIVIRASVGCIPNRIPAGSNKKLSRMTAETGG
jgi:hypothetical protein